ncbi:MAG: radical SAM protein [Eubacteriales bacterium]
MDHSFKLSDYVNNGIESVIKGIIKASLKNPKETAFIIKFASAVKKAQKKRQNSESNGENLPAFLIASISGTCNLFCTGCYARANHACGEASIMEQMSGEKWKSIFEEAKEMGISFILLAGGEPFMRRDILEKAAEIKNIMFPIFTNGTMLQEENIKLLDKNRNLVPILSIDGNKAQTDLRRGKGTYDVLMDAMDKLNQKGILYGASITVTTDNIRTVTPKEYFHELYQRGCKAVIFVEYVPVTQDTQGLAPSEYERSILERELEKLRKGYQEAVFLSFPGDEKYSGGCLAAGRGFFHINVDGSAEPCPFSPYSDVNLKEASLREALNSSLFRKLHDTGMLLGDHQGGCILFDKEEEVKALIRG